MSELFRHLDTDGDTIIFEPGPSDRLLASVNDYPVYLGAVEVAALAKALTDWVNDRGIGVAAPVAPEVAELRRLKAATPKVNCARDVVMALAASYVPDNDDVEGMATALSPALDALIVAARLQEDDK